MFKKFKISCDQATTICDKSQYGKVSISEIVLLKIHFLRCNICSLYTKQNTLLSKIYKTKANTCKNHNKCLTLEQKEALKARLKELDK
ncbi:hypothetical protein [Polaribacter sp.]|uniref:hypothetical protein n=1 Tax=Polaribacter sp. TaxID=1920175 RepID=UPI003EF3601F